MNSFSFYEAAVHRCSSKQLLLKISQYSELARSSYYDIFLKKGFLPVDVKILIDFLGLEEQLKMG